MNFKHIFIVSCVTILLLSCKVHKKIETPATTANKKVETKHINPQQPEITTPTINTNPAIITKTENLTLEDFNAIASSAKIIIIDFNAVWCGPCKRLTPMLEQLETEYGDKIKIVKIDVDKNVSLANYFRIESIPLLYFYKDGKLMNQVMGLPSKANLKYDIEKLLK